MTEFGGGYDIDDNNTQGSYQAWLYTYDGGIDQILWNNNIGTQIELNYLSIMDNINDVPIWNDSKTRKNVSKILIEHFENPNKFEYYFNGLIKIIFDCLDLIQDYKNDNREIVYIKYLSIVKSRMFVDLEKVTIRKLIDQIAELQFVDASQLRLICKGRLIDNVSQLDDPLKDHVKPEQTIHCAIMLRGRNMKASN